MLHYIIKGEWMRELTDSQSSRMALLWRTDAPNSKLAIFVHGFGGKYLATWGEFPQLLKDNADSVPGLAEWDFLFTGYPTFGVTGVGSFGDIASLIQTRLDDALHGLLENKCNYKRVALLGHSLGTLGIRNLVSSPLHCPATEFASVQAIGLYGSPLKGAFLANFGQFVAPIGSALRPGSSQLAALWTCVSSGWASRPWSRAHIQRGMKDLVVGAPFEKWPGDAWPPRLVPATHSSICKPKSMHDDPVTFLKRVLL